MIREDDSPSLNSEERRCLEYLSYHPGVEISHFGEQLISQQLARGLIEEVIHLAIPILPQQSGYQLTARGRSVLQSRE